MEYGAASSSREFDSVETWYQCAVLGLSIGDILLGVVMVMHAKNSRLILLNKLSLAPHYALMCFLSLLMMQ